MDRRIRLALGGFAAILIAGALVAPVVLSGGGSSNGCSATLIYRGDTYTVRAVRDNSFVQAIAIGVGVTRGCGAKPANVDIRSLVGISPRRAVALAGGSEVYVRRGVCSATGPAALHSCLTR